MKRALWVFFWSLLSLVGGYHLLSGAFPEVITPISKFKEVFSIVTTNYVDSVDEAREVESAIYGMLEELDPHSQYIPKKEVEKAEEPLTGSFDGIGIEFNIIHDTILVVAPIAGGPSEALGIQAGDKIIKIDGKSAVGFTIDDVMKTLRGPRGTKVTVTIIRPGVAEPLEFTITRDKIPITSVDAAYMLNDTIGYIKVSRFAGPTPHEFYKALVKLRRAGMQRLILDLRDNPGGYLQASVMIADELIKADRTITYTEGRARPRQDYVATDYGNFETRPLAVLINEGSASASEILSGAVQDWDRGIVVGRRSFGKGLVQENFRLRDGAILRLTVARYHTPSGRVIQRPYHSGKRGLLDYEMDIVHRWERGEYFNKDSIQFPDSLKYHTHGGRVVYGGGGIMPDIFVPLDTVHVSTYLNAVIRRGLLTPFVVQYLETRRPQLLQQYPTATDFARHYSPPTSLLNSLLRKAQAEELPRPSPAERKAFFQYAPERIKAVMARHLYGMKGYWEVLNLHDPVVQTALKTLVNDTAYNHILKPQTP